MNKKITTIIGIIAFGLFITIAVFTYNILSTEFKSNISLDIVDKEVEQLPDEENKEEVILALDFTALDNEGNEVKLSDYFGKPIVLNFWASWCPPCKSEMPHFNKIYEEVKEEVIFLMVDMVDGMQETEEKGKKYISDNNFTFPVLFDTKQEAALTYGIRSIPTTIFINKDGNIVTGVMGAVSEEILLKGVNLIK